MKVILSRKGFDSAHGGYPSPILPNGKLVSLPIPSNNFTKYSDLKLDYKHTYFDLMKQLNPKIKFDEKWHELTKNTECHLDPDVYKEVIERPKDWKALFGQIGGAQTHLKKRVGVGDLFLFFGTFRKIKKIDGKIIFDPEDSEKHIIFGYLQISEIIEVKPNTKLLKWMIHHPHAEKSRRDRKNNTLYVARKTLLDTKLPGASILRYHKDLVLTKENCSKSRWKLPSFFKEVKISYHSNSSWKENYFQSACIGQEFVIPDNKKVEDWAKKLIKKNIKSPLFF